MWESYDVLYHSSEVLTATSISCSSVEALASLVAKGEEGGTKNAEEKVENKTRPKRLQAKPDGAIASRMAVPTRMVFQRRDEAPKT